MPATAWARKRKKDLFTRLEQSFDAKSKKKRPTPAPPRVKVAPHETQGHTRLLQPPIPGARLEAVTQTCDPQGNIHSQMTWRLWHTRSTLTVAGDTWTDWSNNIQLTANTYTTAATWDAWNTPGSHVRQSILLPGDRGYGSQVLAESNEARRVREDRERQYQADQVRRNAQYAEDERVRKRKHEEAEDKALKLLVSMLDERQRSDLKSYKYFFVEAPSGRLYRIDYGMHGNVKVVDRQTRKIIERLCIQPPGVMAGDANLMQKLLIETAEEAFRAHANITLENGAVIPGRYGGLSDERLDNVIPLRRAA